MSVPLSARNFLDYEPLLWRVLSKLARDGYAIQPHDARDLIHDFFLEWEPLNRRYDAAKGDFAPYLATAFYRFGRRRQLKLHRLRARAVDIEECLDLASAEPLPLETAEMKQQIAQFKAALEQLPETEQALLADFLSDFAPGERELAEKHHLTRYRLRERLAATVSRLALQLMETGQQAGDADIAYRVWVMDQSPRRVAAQLGISTEQVNQAKARFAQALLDSIRGAERPERQGRNIMPELDILRRALTAFNDNTALEQLRSNALQIRQLLDQRDLELDAAECAALAEHPQWLASVYAALGNDDAMEAETDDVQSDMAAILENEQQVIADAWAALLDKLDDMRPPAGMGRWEQALAAAGQPDPGLLRHLREHHPSCREGDPAAQRLLQYGLTPGMVFEALRHMALLFNRSLRRGGRETLPGRREDGEILIEDRNKRAVVSQKLLQGNLAGTLDLELELVPAFTESLFCMLQVSPLLVDGYRCSGENRFSKLEKTLPAGTLSRDDLVRRWCTSERELALQSSLLQSELALAARYAEAHC